MQGNNTRGTERPSMLFEDLTEGLVWPKLLRAGGLALRPERIGLGMAIVVMMYLIDQIGALWHNAEKEGPFVGLGGAVFDSLFGNLGSGGYDSSPYGSGPGLLEGIARVAENIVTLPTTMMREYPVSVFVLGPLLLLVWAVMGGAISRSVMSEVSLAKVPAWPQVLGSAVKCWMSLFFAMLVPLAIIAVCYYVIAVFGLGFHVPVVNILTAVLYGLGLVLGLFAALVLVAYVLGGWMLVPAVMAEGTDALDGVQRSLAYVWSRPIRTVLYLALLGLVGYIAISIVAAVGTFSMHVAQSAATTWGPDDVWSSGQDGTTGLTHRILLFWHALVAVIIGGYAVSYIHTAGALQYLCLRRVCDGQEIGELWEEGI